MAVADDETSGAPGAAEGLAEPGADEVTDPAAEAATWRQAAQAARARAEHVRAEAQQRAREITAAAEAEASRLGLQADEADAEAARWQREADRDAEIAVLTAQIAVMQEARDRLAAEARDLDETAGRLSARIEELAAQHAEAGQRKAMAVRGDDEAALREAASALVTAAELGQARQAELSAAQARLGQIRGEDGELAAVVDRLGRALVRLADLRRDEQGLPPLRERQSVVAALVMQMAVMYSAADPDALIGMLEGRLPDEGARRELRRQYEALGDLGGGEAARRSVAAPVLAAACVPLLEAWLDTLAAQAPDQYAAVKAAHLDGVRAPRAAVPSLEELLSGPGFVELGDGFVRYETPRRGL